MTKKNLIEKFARGEHTKDDEGKIAELFKDRSATAQIEKLLSEEWDQTTDAEVDLKHILHTLNYEINMEGEGNRNVNRRRNIIRWAAEIAIAAVVAIGVFFAIEYYKESPAVAPIAFAELQAPTSARVEFTLPDGTVGWLNSGSMIRYPLDFCSSREVELVGEALFDVVKGESQFTVLTNKSKLVVLGTRFNVNTDAEGRTTEVVLQEGKVQFIYDSHKERKSVAMEPGEKLVYDSDADSHVVSKTNVEDYTQWINGRFIVRDESIAKFAQQFGRRFNIEIEVADRELYDLRFRATFENESPEEILRLLKLITPIDYYTQERELQADGTFSKKQITIIYKP